MDVVSPGQPGWDDGVDDLVRLHAERARLAGRPEHNDLFAGTGQERCLRGMPPGTAAGPVISVLRQDGIARAALLTLESSSVTAISASGAGAGAEAWELNAVTSLQQHAIQRAVDAGRRTACFAPGVDTAKLRWGCGRGVTHRFSLVHPGRSSVLAYQLASIVRRHHNLSVRLNHFASTAARRHDELSRSSAPASG